MPRSPIDVHTTDGEPAHAPARLEPDWVLIVLDAAQDVSVLTLSSPPVNALGEALLDEIDTALDIVELRRSRVLVIGSPLPRFFATGADLALIQQFDSEEYRHYLGRVHRVIERIARRDAISIAALHGHVAGGGLELALASTIRIAEPRTVFSLPEVGLGLIPGAGGTQRLPLLVGRGRALDLMLSGRRIDAVEAERIGLITRVSSENGDIATRWNSQAPSRVAPSRQ